MKGKMRALVVIIVIAACMIAAGRLTDKNDKSDQTAVNDTGVVVFGSEIRQTKDGWGNITDYTERESFTWSLMQDSAPYDYAMAEITVGEESAVFDWTFGEAREELAGHYTDVKNALAAKSDKETADYWLFLKMDTADVYDLDIWHKVQEVWGSDLEENHEIYAWVNEPGNVCQICEYEEGTAIGGWNVYIKDDFLYVLECVDHQISSREETRNPINYFYWNSVLTYASQYCMWGMDDELFYWRDHDERITRLENPTRVYTQVPGKDDRWSHFPGKQPCGVVQKAEYTVSPAEGSPALQICFTLDQDAMELELPSIGPADHKYTMEVSDAVSGELLQTAEASLCVDAIDTLRFADMDGDGYLDMHIVYPEHSIVAESDAKDQFSYTYYWYRKGPRFWIWDNEERIFVCMNERELSDHKQERKEEQRKEDTAPKEQVIIVQKGDSLWRIAKKYLGDGAKYMELYEWNKAVIGADPDKIIPGMELEIADVEKSSFKIH